MSGTPRFEAPGEIYGRDEEVRLLDGFASAARLGPSALLIRGRPGIGKTTAWLSVLATASQAGYRVLSSRSVEAEAKMSFTTLGDLLGSVVDEAREDLPEPQQRAIDAALLRVGDMRADRRAVSLAASALLRSIGRAGPVLVAIDDVQWVDPASAKILSFALRRLDGAPIAVVVTLRDEPGARDRLDLRDAFGEPDLQILEFSPLDAASLGRLLRRRLGADLPRTLVGRIHAACEGNPFFALEMGRALLHRGVLPTPGEPLPVPEDLRGLLRTRVRVLPAETRDALLLASAMVRPTLDLVHSAAERPDLVRSVLVPATEAGVIDVEGDLIRFAHPLLASTVYSEASSSARRAAHDRLARVVADGEERVRHMALASTGPDEAVATALEEAARAALFRGAPDSAAELQELALTLTTSSDETRRRSSALLAATYRYAAGDARTAHERLEHLIDATPKGPDRAELWVELSRMLWNDVDRVRRSLEEADAEAGDDAPATLRLKIENDLGFVGQFGGDLPEASRRGRAALALAEEIGDPYELSFVLASLAYGEFLLGRPVRALFERAISLEEAVEQRPLRIVSARRALGATLMWAGDLDHARAELELERRESARIGAIAEDWERLAYLAELELRAGNWELASTYAEEGLDSTVETGLEQAREVHLWSTALVAAHRGDTAVARANATEGLAIAQAHGDVFHIVTNRSVLGLLELSLGNAERAHRWMGPLVELTERWGLGEPGAFPFMPDEIEALLSLGDPDAALSLLERLEAQGRALDRPLALATAARCRGLLASSRGDLVAAEDALKESFAHHERIPQPFDLARTLLVAGRIDRRFKKKASARGSLTRALEIFDGLGAQRWSALAREELARISGRSASPTELTLTEQQVADLVALGRSNAEVAAQLFMSVNTVRSNLRRIYAKLGIRSRSELASIRGHGARSSRERDSDQ